MNLRKEAKSGPERSSFFGLPYVEMFGRETIKTVPCLVEEIGADQFMFLTSEEPREETAELLAIQERVEKHLGKEVFFRHKEEDKKQKIFTMEEIRQGKDIPDTNGYRAPFSTRCFLEVYGKVNPFQQTNKNHQNQNSWHGINKRVCRNR